MSETRPIILCVASDRRLLDTRVSVVATRYRALAASSIPELESLAPHNSPDLVLLCHTLSGNQCRQACQIARQRWPRVILLAITAEYKRPDSPVDDSIENFNGPAALLDRIAALLQAPLGPQDHRQPQQRFSHKLL